MNGRDILEKMREVYLSFDSYSDVGTVESIGLPGPGLEFQTYFKRPLNYRFHWRSWHPYFGKSKQADENTVWSNGESFASSYHGEIEHSQSFAMMLAGAAGISRGSVLNILNIIVPGTLQLSQNWHEMTEVRSLPEELVDNVECFHIIGTAKNSEDTEVWIEKNSFIVRCLKETIIITEEMSAQMRVEQQSMERVEIMKEAAKKAGMSDENLEKTLAHLVTVGFEPMTYSHIYKYTTVTVDQPIDDTLFSDL